MSPGQSRTLIQGFKLYTHIRSWWKVSVFSLPSLVFKQIDLRVKWWSRFELGLTPRQALSLSSHKQWHKCVCVCVCVCVFACSKTPITPTMTFLLVHDSDGWPKSPWFVGQVCAHTESGDCISHRQSDRMEGHVHGGRWEEGCMWQGGGVFLRVIGWTTAHPLCSKSRGICWPLWLPACSPARELREGISAPQSRWQAGFFKIVLSGFLALLFYPRCLSLRFVLGAVHSQPQPAIV